ncbi:MAG: NAD-dependent DNA ligase LigA [Lachnospiraceae bacterium]|nr:NAD-dependent DNA ligase LigA [Lachnospiraceae bacterium]
MSGNTEKNETNKKMERMKELVSVLGEASRVYYQGSDEIMSNYEYDRLYDELLALEKELGVTMAGSPTTKVGYEVISELPKERHGYAVLSLDKTKDVGALKTWLGDRDGVLSWKLDGLTVVATYESGELLKAVTRGNGEVGEVITHNARKFVDFPLAIPYKERLVVRGEALIRYDDFDKINSSIPDTEEKYKNPRNLCSGTVRQLNSSITAERSVHFLAYNILDSGHEFKYNSEMLAWLESQGFEVVGHDVVNSENIEETVRDYSDAIGKNVFPSDGLVLTFDDIEYGLSLGNTAKFPRHSIAFKWADETAQTTLTDIEWSASRTGLINPVAIFEPVELEGTTVSRASVHNVSIVESLRLGIGDTIHVYKANMIIPQIAENLTCSANAVIPKTCPVCGSQTVIKQENGVKTLNCPNKECLAKQIKSFTHFVSRQAMNIDGLSEATIEKFIACRILCSITDLFHLDGHKDEIITMPGFGEKSYNNLIKSVDNARKVELPNFIYSLGISGIGLSNAKTICREYGYDIDKIRNLTEDELTDIDGIGEVLAGEWISYMSDEKNREMIEKLLAKLTLIKPENDVDGGKLEGITVVITGRLEHFSGRDELKKLIEGMGGKVTGSVTGKTDYLINNNINSGSSKNKKAKDLGVDILTEDDFIKRFDILPRV